jgi:hypothetical protein
MKTITAAMRRQWEREDDEYFAHLRFSDARERHRVAIKARQEESEPSNVDGSAEDFARRICRHKNSICIGRKFWLQKLLPATRRFSIAAFTGGSSSPKAGDTLNSWTFPFFRSTKTPSWVSESIYP